MKKYTLIELLVAMGIFAFMMLLLMNFFGTSTDLLGRENSRATKLYEASVITSIIQQDLKNLTVNNTQKPFEYFRSGNNTTLRFFTTGYDEGGPSVDTEKTTSIMITYQFNATNYTLTRYVESVTDFETDNSTTLAAEFTAGSNNKINDFDEIEKDTYGGVMLEGIEQFDVLLYEADRFKIMSSTSPLPAINPTYSNRSSSDNGLTNKPDAITIQMTLNNKNITDLIKDGSISSNSTRGVQNRRTITQQYLLGYND